jgi:hypothetical protein
VRRQGYPEATESFDSKQAAERWARSVEAEMDKGLYRTAWRKRQFAIALLDDFF